MNEPLVTARSNHPANVVFTVEGRTRNGWLSCRTFCQQDGTPMHRDHVFRFRVSAMRTWTPPQLQEAAS